MPIIRDEGGIEFQLRVKDLPEDEFRVFRFDGVDALSTLYEFDVEVVSENPEVDFAAVVGKPAALSIRGKVVDDTPQPDSHLHGMIASLEQGPIGERLTTYYVKLVPRFWALLNRTDTRTFQDATAPEIIREVFQAAGVPDNAARQDLKDSYARREFCVQYQESDWAFVSRLMEEEGISYFFEHNEDDHVLVLADDVSVYAEIPDGKEIPYRDPSGTQTGEDSITDFRFAQKVRPGAVTLRDYNFEKPKTSLDALKQSETDTDLARFEFGRYQHQPDGERYAKVRLEEQQTTRRVARGVSSVRRFRSGRRFALTDFTRPDRNTDYVLVRVEHHGYEPQAKGVDAPVPEEGKAIPKYRNEFEAVPSDAPIRPARITPRPFIRGPQSAVVVGPSGEEIYTDPYGRVKVHFHWDRHKPLDEGASCWIRVAQTLAGAGWGANFLPRIGQEVLVSFLEGDPDRPYIVGGLYNEDMMPPYELPGNKTMSTLKSATSPGSEGFNEIRFEDKSDSEQIYMHAQRDLELKVLNDRHEQVENDAHLIIKNDHLASVGNERHVKVGADDVTEVVGDQHLKVSGKQAIEVTGSLSQKVGGNAAQEFKGNHSAQVTMNYFLKAMGVVIESSTGLTLKCGGSSVVIDPSGVTLKGAMVVVDGSMVRIASGPGSPPTPGQAGSLVPPMAPREPFEVEDPDPGRAAEARAEQQQTGEGRYGAAPIVAFRRGEPGEDEPTSWVEIELVDEEGNPVPGERYEITLASGEVVRGTLDENGCARVEGIEPGDCDITFPELDEESWE